MGGRLLLCRHKKNRSKSGVKFKEEQRGKSHDGWAIHCPFQRLCECGFVYGVRGWRLFFVQRVFEVGRSLRSAFFQVCGFVA